MGTSIRTCRQRVIVVVILAAAAAAFLLAGLEASEQRTREVKRPRLGEFQRDRTACSRA
jgi:hypothetical protein